MFSFESLDADFDIYGLEQNKKKYNPNTYSIFHIKTILILI
jgi:hypothetical protein